MLESIDGKVGKLISIDGSPFLLKQFANILSNDVYMNQLTFKLLTGNNSTMLNEKDDAQKNVPNKSNDQKSSILQLVDAVQDYTSNPENQIIAFRHALVNRLQSAENYDLINFNKIKSPLMLVRPIKCIFQTVPDDYELAKCTEGAVSTKMLDCDHQTIIKHPELAGIISEFIKS